MHDNKKILEGVHENYLFNGNLWFRGDFKYKNKKLTGYVDFFWENGQLETKRVYKNGLLNGPYERFYENGQLETKRFYKNGLLIEESESFFKNGRVCYKGNDLNFSDNHDSVYCWQCEFTDVRLDHENNLEPEEYYKHECIPDNLGRIISYIYPHEEKHISGVHECFYDSGHYYKKVHTRFSFINGKKHGFEEEYSYCGKLVEKTLWINGVCIDSSDSWRYEFFLLTEDEKNEIYKPLEVKLNKVSVTNSYSYEKGITSEFIFYTKDYSYLYQSTYFRSGNLRSQLEISKGKMHYYEFYASGENKLKLLLDLNEKDLDLTKVKTKLMHWNKGHTPKDWIHKFL